MVTQKSNPAKSYIASVRTALSGPEDGIMRKLPEEYRSNNVKGVLGYLTDKKQVTQEEIATVRSIEREMSKDYTLAVNGRNAQPTDPVADLFVPKEHKNVCYLALEIEVASVQEGGLTDFLK
jgi:hypothetical protein